MDFMFGVGSNFLIIVLIFIWVNLLLTQLAKSMLGSYMPWLVVFPLLPVVSHVVFLYLIILKWHKQRALKVVQDITYTTDGLTPDGHLLVHVNKENQAVTPFDDPDSEDTDEDENEDEEKEIEEMEEEEKEEKTQEYSVTPFGTPPVFVEAKPEVEILSGLNQMRFEKIEEMMTAEKWTDAYFVANLGLETARSEGDQESIEKFESYREKIEENLPLTDS